MNSDTIEKAIAIIAEDIKILRYFEKHNLPAVEKQSIANAIVARKKIIKELGPTDAIKQWAKGEKAASKNLKAGYITGCPWL